MKFVLFLVEYVSNPADLLPWVYTQSVLIYPQLVKTLLSPKCHLVPIVVQETAVAYQDSTLDREFMGTLYIDLQGDSEGCTQLKEHIQGLYHAT